MQPDTTPEARPQTLILSVEQGLTSLLDIHPGQDEIPVQRQWLIYWLRLLGTARLARGEPIPMVIAVGFAALSGALVMFGVCIVWHL